MTGTDHWARATAGLPAPLVAVDLDAFDANADDLVRRAGGLPVRVASKSVRCRTLLDRVLARPGFAGVMAYAVPEAVWLVEAGVRDVFVAYPSVDEAALRAVATDDLLRGRGDRDDRLRRARALAARHPRGRRRRARRRARLRRVAAGGPGAPRGAPLADPRRRAGARRRAGGPGRRARRAGRDVLRRPGRRPAGCRAAHPHDEAALGARAGGAARRGRDARARARPTCASSTPVAPAACTGSGATGSVTELAAGSGLYAPDPLRRLRRLHPTAGDGVRPARRAAPGARATSRPSAGGYVASGEPGWSRVPSPVRRGL